MFPGDPFGGGFFGGMPPFFALFFIMFFVVFTFAIVSSIKSYVRNSNSPIISVEAKIIAKRIDVSNHTHHDNNNHAHHSSTTTYYMTFQTEHGERLELSLSGRIYGQLIEGDTGVLTYQGSWFKDFQRKPIQSFNNEEAFKKDNSQEYKEY